MEILLYLSFNFKVSVYDQVINLQVQIISYIIMKDESLLFLAQILRKNLSIFKQSDRCLVITKYNWW